MRSRARCSKRWARCSSSATTTRTSASSSSPARAADSAAGLDLKDATAGTGIGAAGNPGMPVKLDLRSAPPTVLHGLDTPTICALNGGAAGYGMDLALGCDIRIAAESAKLAAAFTRRGVLPESGGTWLLPRLVGWAKAAEIIFTGRTLSAEQCLSSAW